MTTPVIDGVVLIPDSHGKPPMGSVGTHDISHRVPWRPVVDPTGIFGKSRTNQRRSAGYHGESHSFPRNTTGIPRDSEMSWGPVGIPEKFPRGPTGVSTGRPMGFHQLRSIHVVISGNPRGSPRILCRSRQNPYSTDSRGNDGGL